MTVKPIDYCQRDHFLMRYQVGVSLKIRQQMFDAMPLKPGMSVLEVGTTPDTSFADQNFFSKKALSAGCHVTVTSIEDCSDMARQNGFEWVSWDQLNGTGKKFDGVISAAVLEHVGDTAAKLEHLRLLNRLSQRYVIVTTPNRGHWFEVHTKLPLIHWLPKTTHRALLRGVGLSEWADPVRLDLVGASDFQRLVQEANPGATLQFKTFRLFGAISNLMAIIQK